MKNDSDNKTKSSQGLQETIQYLLENYGSYGMRQFHKKKDDEDKQWLMKHAQDDTKVDL
jgi:hypothetical protein